MTPKALEPVELLGCPFCGGGAELQDLGDPQDDSFVNCTRCEVQQIANYTPSEAIRRWNTRAQPLPDIEKVAKR